MTDDQWGGLCLLIEEGFPGEFTDTTAKAWRLFLEDYDAGQVLVAIKALVAQGGTFRPSVAEVVGMIRNDPSKPTFDEAYQLIYGSRGVLRARAASGTYPDPASIARAQDAAARERAAGMHPLVALFVDRFGLDRLRMLQVDHEIYGEPNKKQLREAWAAHCDAFEGREVAALASGRRGEIGRFDPFGALDRGKPAQIAEGTSA